MTAKLIKKRKFEWQTSYSAFSQSDAEERIGEKFTDLFNNAKQIETIINNKTLDDFSDKINSTKDKIYTRIVECIEVEDYPAGNIEPFKEENITDLAGIILIATIADFRQLQNNSNIKLRREKKIVSIDNVTGGEEEFVVVDVIDICNEKIVLIVEAKKSTIAEALKQCTLALKDAYDNNHDNKNIYGFITTGLLWQFVIYNGKQFNLSEDFKVAFPLMKNDKTRWLKDFSIIVDVIYFVLYETISIDNILPTF